MPDNGAVSSSSSSTIMECSFLVRMWKGSCSVRHGMWHVFALNIVPWLLGICRFAVRGVSWIMTTQSVSATTQARAWIYGVMLVHQVDLRLLRSVQMERPVDGNLILQLKMHSEMLIFSYCVIGVLLNLKLCCIIWNQNHIYSESRNVIDCFLVPFAQE